MIWILYQWNTTTKAWQKFGTYPNEFDARSQYYYLVGNGIPGNQLRLLHDSDPVPVGPPSDPPLPGQ